LNGANIGVAPSAAAQSCSPDGSRVLFFYAPGAWRVCRRGVGNEA
jgi:hypothetical protein